MATSATLFSRTGPRKNSQSGDSVLVSGFEEIDAVLREFPRKVAVPVVVSTLSAGLQEAVRGIRRAVPPATTPGHNTRSVKASVGRSPNREIKRLAQGYRVTAKVGIGVGQGSNAAKKLGEKGSALRVEKGRQVRNAQAYVAGTVRRYRASQDGVRSTGAVTSTPIVDLGIAASQSRILAAMIAKGRKAFERKATQLAARANRTAGKALGASLRGVLS